MIKIGHVREVEALKGLSSEVVDVIREAVTILDTEYGESRDVDRGYGGYVLIIEDEAELVKLKDIYIDVETVIPEYVDVIECEDERVFTSSLVLVGSEFGVIIIMPIFMLPAKFKELVTISISKIC